MFEYRADARRVVDGDTLDLRIDLGFTVGVDVRVRLYGIDTPEVYGTKKKDPEQYARGKAASQFAAEWLAEAALRHGEKGPPLRVTTKKGTGKYGRWLAEIWRKDDDVSLNEALVESGNAVEREY